MTDQISSQPKVMSIELRNLQIFDRMSEETTAFAADLYIDGVKRGYCKNDGHGGCTFYHAYSHEKDYPFITAAEAYAKSLPDVVYPKTEYMHSFSVKSNLELIIDTLVEEAAQEKENKKFRKAAEKKMLTAILFGKIAENITDYRYIQYKRPLADILKTPAGIDAIKKQIAFIKGKLEPGQGILNTNIPADILNF